MSLYLATTSFLEATLSLDETDGTSLTANGTYSTGSSHLIYSTNYIFQMMLAAGFALFKLKNSHFAQQGFIELEYTKNIFLRTIWAIRKISTASNDLQQRLAEVLAQVWKSGSSVDTNQSGTNTGFTGNANPNASNTDDALQLKVKCRNSMSLVYDSVWRWREDFVSRGKSFDSKSTSLSIDSTLLISMAAFLKNPTDPAAGTDSSSSSVTPGGINGNQDTSVATSGGPMVANPMIAGMPGMATGLAGLNGMGYADPNSNYEVFDPLNWMLDGLVDFPYTVPGIDPSSGGAGIGLG